MKGYQVFREIVKEALADEKLGAALAIDGYGALSAFAYLLGPAGAALDTADLATGPAQTGYIMAVYGSDLTFKDKLKIGALSMAEEMLPGPTDLIPTVTIAHVLAAYRRATRNKGDGYLDVENYQIK